MKMQAKGLVVDAMYILLENYLTQRPWNFAVNQGRSVKDISAQYAGSRVGLALGDPNCFNANGHMIASEAGDIYDPRPEVSGPVRVEAYEFKNLFVKYFFTSPQMMIK